MLPREPCPMCHGLGIPWCLLCEGVGGFEHGSDCIPTHAWLVSGDYSPPDPYYLAIDVALAGAEEPTPSQAGSTSYWEGQWSENKKRNRQKLKAQCQSKIWERVRSLVSHNGEVKAMNCPDCGHEFDTDELKAAAKEVARRYGLKGASLRYKKKEFPQKRAPRTDQITPRKTILYMKHVWEQVGLAEDKKDVD